MSTEKLAAPARRSSLRWPRSATIHENLNSAQASDNPGASLTQLCRSLPTGIIMAIQIARRPIRITRRGKPAAVLVSEADFQRSHKPQKQGPGDAILAWREYGGVQLTDAEIDGWRDGSVGPVPDFSGEK